MQPRGRGYMGKLKIERMTLGSMATNCYLIRNEDTKELLIVDPADWADRIMKRIRELDGIPMAILLTHGHFDHIGAAEKLRDAYEIPIYALQEEAEVLASEQLNLSGMFGKPMTLTPDVLLKDGQKLKLLGEEILVLHTPGHTQGGACYYFAGEQMLLSGDTLFCGSVGRSDFPTGSMSVLVRSIREKLFALPEETRVYPGHDEETSIGDEKRYNPFL